jgi:hypothetical protein
MAKVERRKPTRAEWRILTSRRPVVRRIAQPKTKPKGMKEEQ